MSLLTHPRHLSSHLQDVSLATSKTSLLPPPRHSLSTSKSVTPIATMSKMIPLKVTLATSKTSLLTSKMSLFPPPRHRSCQLQAIALATSKTYLFPPPRLHSFHLQAITLSTSKTSLLPPPICLFFHVQDISLAMPIYRAYGVYMGVGQSNLG
jgi:hypothetical protein